MTEDTRLHRLYARARLDDREVNELIGLAHGIIADGVVNKAEVDYLQKWLIAHEAAVANPVVGKLLDRVDTILADGTVDAEEAIDLFSVLQRLAGGDFELGETVRASALPFDEPAPVIEFSGTRFCFTGTFGFGTRKDCEAAVKAKGGICGPLTMDTGFLIIGAYATDSWAHSTFGRKIEKAIEMRAKGVSIAIVGEIHWVSQLRG